MSTIRDFLDQLNIVIQSELVNYKQLPNPYVLADNIDINLMLGWGVSVGPSNQSNLDQTYKFFNVSRTLVFSTTIVTRHKENDINLREESERTLLEEHESAIISILKAVPELPVEKMDFIGDTGVQFVFDERTDYLFIESTFTFDYAENINYC